MKDSKQLLNNIIGQLEGVKKMIDENEECFDVLVQLKAARSANSNLIDKYVEENFNEVLKSCNEKEREKVCKKFFSEIIKRN